MPDALVEGQILLADRAFDCAALRQSLTKCGAFANINTRYDKRRVNLLIGGKLASASFSSAF